VHAFAVEGDVDPTSVVSNTFTLEWPPRSGRMQAFPEIDRAGWFGLDEARRKIVAGQRPIVDEMRARFAGSSAP
jgi:predicted NUDIX family NTP pyrophosphohydrolase